MANTFIRTWALMTELQKKARGLEWIVDLIVQLHDNCTVPKYFDRGCASLWCGNHGRGAAVSRAAERRQPDGGGKDGWQRGGGTSQQEQRFGQCSGGGEDRWATVTTQDR